MFEHLPWNLDGLLELEEDDVVGEGPVSPERPLRTPNSPRYSVNGDIVLDSIRIFILIIFFFSPKIHIYMEYHQRSSISTTQTQFYYFLFERDLDLKINLQIFLLFINLVKILSLALNAMLAMKFLKCHSFKKKKNVWANSQSFKMYFLIKIFH